MKCHLDNFLMDFYSILRKSQYLRKYIAMNIQEQF